MCVLVRTGLPPKRLIPFRTDTPFSKISIKFIGTKERLEFLGDSQQFVAFGTHPDTMQPYTWRGVRGEADCPSNRPPHPARGGRPQGSMA